MIEVFFLGTSAGAPTLKRGLPAIALRYKGQLFLWDVGECAQRQLLKHKLGFGIDGIFISHLHLDHFLGLYGLWETLKMQNLPEMPQVYAPKGFPLINDIPVKQIRSGKVYQGEDFEIRAFRVKHIGGSYGFVFEQAPRRKFIPEKIKGLEPRHFISFKRYGYAVVGGKEVSIDEVSYLKPGLKVAYTGDTMYYEAIVEEIKGADLLIHEATFREADQQDAIQKKHSTIADAARIAQKAGVKTLVLTHISSRYDKVPEEELIQEAKRYFQGEVILAHDGLKLEVK
ncbi:MAG: MBL fold metallo-hydrolase [Candidatus Micrarchaeota archaeon]|nr:MBL fold metallo-hydrolase [Candidatus Micrarchaeota archaeon]